MGKWAWLQKLGKVMGKMAPKWAGIQNVEVGQLTLEFCPFHYLGRQFYIFEKVPSQYFCCKESEFSNSWGHDCKGLRQDTFCGKHFSKYQQLDVKIINNLF